MECTVSGTSLKSRWHAYDAMAKQMLTIYILTSSTLSIATGSNMYLAW